MCRSLPQVGDFGRLETPVYGTLNGDEGTDVFHCVIDAIDADGTVWFVGKHGEARDGVLEDFVPEP